MWNFIDDSGSFSWGHNKGKSIFCGVTVSDVELPDLESRFLAWKRTIVGNSTQELKGSQLNANQLYSFSYKVLPPNRRNIHLTLVSGDTSITDESCVERMRDQAAELFRLSSELCAKYKSDENKNDKIIETYRQMSGWVGKRSTVNVLWIVVLMQAILDTLQHGIVRFAEPEFSCEFENIEFAIDRSFIHREEHLQFWKAWLRADLMKPSRIGTFIAIKNWPPDHPFNRKYRVYKGLVNLNDLFQKHTDFHDSKSMIGLQIADICANICYRYFRDDNADTRAYDTLRPYLVRRGWRYVCGDRTCDSGLQLSGCFNSNQLIGLRVLLRYSNYQHSAKRMRERRHREQCSISPLLLEIEHKALSRPSLNRFRDSRKCLDCPEDFRITEARKVIPVQIGSHLSILT